MSARGVPALVVLGAVAGLVVSACGSSTPPPRDEGPTVVTPTISPIPSTSPVPTVSPVPNVSPSPHGATGVIATGPKSATCLNGWTQPAPGSDFFKQASAALEQNQGVSGYALKSVRYFAGPLASGGIGAIYYLDVTDPRLTARVLLVSGAGPAQAAVAKSGTTGWKAGEWIGFRGTEAAAVHPPLPGKWSGPEFDAVTASPAFLLPAVAGCLAGT